MNWEIMDRTLARLKINFWITWVISNAMGLGFGWALGEMAGRYIAETAGWRLGQFVGMLVCEGILWMMRGVVLARVKTHRILKPLDTIIWLATELFAWLVSELPANPDSLMAVTGGAVFAFCLGAGVWVMIWFIRIPKPKTKYWALNAFIWSFLGLVGGGIFIGGMMAVSIQIGYEIEKMSLSIIGMFFAGVVLGALIGSFTGLALIKLLRWPAVEA